jgi:GNAT superfamily N-acetyltransferase
LEPRRKEETVTIEASMQLENFELTLVDITDVDVEKLHTLSISVGWPHRMEDWLMLRENGHGIAAQDEIGRIVGSAMWFPFGEDFATIGMVITSPRLQAHGTGRWLMDHVLNRSERPHQRLNATRAARRLYLSMGFTAEKTVYQHQGTAVALDTPDMPSDSVLREIRDGDLAEICSLDRQASGTERAVLLARLLQVSRGAALIRNDRIVAFSLCRRFGRGSVVGPVVAESDADAILVTHPHIATLAGQFARTDTRQSTGPFAEFLVRSGLALFDTVTSMSRGGAWLNDDPSDRPVVYSLVSQTLS